jgi:hypothetical protein
MGSWDYLRKYGLKAGLITPNQHDIDMAVIGEDRFNVKDLKDINKFGGLISRAIDIKDNGSVYNVGVSLHGETRIKLTRIDNERSYKINTDGESSTVRIRDNNAPEYEAGKEVYKYVLDLMIFRKDGNDDASRPSGEFIERHLDEIHAALDDISNNVLPAARIAERNQIESHKQGRKDEASSKKNLWNKLSR